MFRTDIGTDWAILGLETNHSTTESYHIVCVVLTQRTKNSMNRNNMNVLVTAPHTVCWNETENVCDQSSLRSAELIRLAFKGETVQCLRSHQHRKQADDNRSMWWRSTPLQRGIRAWLKSANPATSFLIDTHSFPEGSDSWGDGFDPAKHDIVLLLFPDYSSLQPTVKRFVDTLRSKYDRVAVLPNAAASNYIIKAAKNRNVPAVLVEFYDPINDQARTRAADAIASAVTDVIRPAEMHQQIVQTVAQQIQMLGGMP